MFWDSDRLRLIRIEQMLVQLTAAASREEIDLMTIQEAVDKTVSEISAIAGPVDSISKLLADMHALILAQTAGTLTATQEAAINAAFQTLTDKTTEIADAISANPLPTT